MIACTSLGCHNIERRSGKVSGLDEDAGDAVLPLINYQEEGEQLHPAGKRPDKGAQEDSAVEQITVDFNCSCPRRAVFFQRCAVSTP